MQYIFQFYKIVTTYCVRRTLKSLSTRARLGQSPPVRAAFTTAQFSELLLTSRISPAPRVLTSPPALSWVSTWERMLVISSRLALLTMCFSQKNFSLLLYLACCQPQCQEKHMVQIQQSKQQEFNLKNKTISTFQGVH